MSESVTLLVATLYAEAIEAVKLRALYRLLSPNLFQFLVIAIPRQGFETDPNL
jgi:hypothetical protein